MAITNLLENQDHQSEASIHQTSKTKIIFIVILFLLSLASFVLQTEFTSQAYKLNFKEPVILLTVTHGSWWLLWPLQILFVSMIRTTQKYTKNKSTKINIAPNSSSIQYQRLNSTSELLEDQELEVPIHQIPMFTYFKKCIIKQFHNVYHTSILIYNSNILGDTSTKYLNNSIDVAPRLSSSNSIISCISTFIRTPSIHYIAIRSFIVTLILTVAGFTWYGAMSMTYPADVTAIYNCSAFTAYAFAIPLLGEKFSWLKISSVIIALVGVFQVAYSKEDVSVKEDSYPLRFWGNLIISVGAILYGYYEVLYKKYLCIPAHLSKIITPRRQSTFANFVMGWFGIYTFVILSLACLLTHITKIHKFNLWNYGDNTKLIWQYIAGSIICNLTFSASFLSLMALTSPVLSSVSSLITIFLIGIVEWIVYGNKLSFQQLFGDCLIIVGFAMLTIASWKEISEGNEDDDVENVSTYSYALSTDEGGNTRQVN
ncbi:unnamed protein product [Candida verbasci]|uniref:EamA domain-containing protein n=1 Tax=Candida verbasci TaxID=1227364 RepID=A0A9W4TUF9_9ASCO|nr:unnamed protein product [Candida verbasci]